MKSLQHSTTDVMAPRPVHPTPIRTHGLFGSTFVNQHMMIDERWSAGSLMDEFSGMTNLLSKRLIFKSLENKSYRKQLHKSTRNLRTQCRDGRTKLQNVLFKSNVLAIRNYLINHKDMQRLYQKMPVQLVVDNINQRTFVMRKERDRLTHRLALLKDEYKTKLLERSTIENRIKFENEFVLEEEIKMREFSKKIENSNVRLKAIKTVNATYQKILQVLIHDEIFYEPIVRSLCKDIDDQANFIKHILYLGMPAIAKFKQLSEEYKQMEDKSRRQASVTMQTINSFKKVQHKGQAQPQKTPKAPELVVNINKRYTRETKSMLTLKAQQEEIEWVIKQIKVATLCSQAKEIFPRFSSQIESNLKLIKQNDIGQLHNDFLAYKEKVAEEQQSVILHNYSEEKENRLQYTKDLERKIKAEDDKEELALGHIKNRADVFVILRYTLWNISDILRHVDRPPRVYSVHYPNSYLQLPLLKFEMLTMRACVPELFMENTKLLLTSVETKVKIIMSEYLELTTKPQDKSSPSVSKMDTTENLWQLYHTNFLLSNENEEEAMDAKVNKELAEDLFDTDEETTKSTQYVPNRKQIKLQSAKLVEELMKKEDV